MIVVIFVVVVVVVFIVAVVVVAVVVTTAISIVGPLTGDVSAMLMLFDWDVRYLTGDVSAHAHLTHSSKTTRGIR